MLPKVIAFNGPPRSGKDTVCNFLQESHPDIFGIQRFALPLKVGAHALLGLSYDEAAYEDCKDVPSPDFFGRTPREVYIMMSERLLKPLCGNEVFGHLWLRERKSELFVEPDMIVDDKIVLIPDCGFSEELKPLIAEYGIDRVMLVRIYHNGCTFEHDSRSYISDIVPNELEIVNIPGEPSRMKQQMEYLLASRQVYAEFYKSQSLEV